MNCNIIQYNIGLQIPTLKKNVKTSPTALKLRSYFGHVRENSDIALLFRSHHDRLCIATLYPRFQISNA